jgi:ribosomal protein S1
MPETNYRVVRAFSALVKKENVKRWFTRENQHEVEQQLDGGQIESLVNSGALVDMRSEGAAASLPASGVPSGEQQSER